MDSRSSGPSLHAQPAPCEYWVSRTRSLIGVFMAGKLDDAVIGGQLTRVVVPVALRLCAGSVLFSVRWLHGFLPVSVHIYIFLGMHLCIYIYTHMYRGPAWWERGVGTLAWCRQDACTGS